MAYEGELLNYCPAHMFNFSRAYYVIVSGARINPKGHMLLNTGGKDGCFFHVTDLYGEPRIMCGSQFDRYLKENEKIIESVVPVTIPNPEKSETELEELLSRKWAWGAIFHNCETMVEQVVMAGGGSKIRTGLLPLPMDATNSCRMW